MYFGSAFCPHEPGCVAITPVIQSKCQPLQKTNRRKVRVRLWSDRFDDRFDTSGARMSTPIIVSPDSLRRNGRGGRGRDHGPGGGLRVCGCLWRIASDDLVIPAWFEFFGRVLGLAAVVGVLVFQQIADLHSCGSHHLDVYLIVAIVIFSLTLINVALLGVHSARGSIWDSDPRARRYVSPLVHANVALTAAETVWALVGSVWVLSGLLDQCLQNGKAVGPVYAVLGIIIATWIGVSVKILLFSLSFNGIDCCKERSNADRNESFIAESRPSLFARTMRFCVKKSKIDFFRDVAKVLALVFDDDRFVPTDIAAALILLYSQPEEAISLESASDGDDLEMPCQVITHDVSATSASADDILAWDNPAVVRHFMSYAGASYGYTWFHMRVASCRPCRLYKHIRCCACCLCFHEQGFIEADNCFSCNTAALRTTLPHLDDESIVHISFKNKLMEVPYFVAVDHTYKKIVISIRGTLSLEDALTDLCAKPESMASYDENLSGYLAHAGMLRAAQYVFAELRSKNILNKAFSYFDGYELCVVGHSLGAGTAVILSFLLRQFHPSLRCYAFSPPGGLLNEAAAKESEKFVVSIIVGKDLVPRLSFQSLTLLKERMKDVLKSCPLPKYQILATGLYSCCVKDTTQSLVRSRTEAVSGRSSSGESVDSSDPILRHEADSQSQPQYESLTDIYAQQQRRQSQSQIPFLHRMILPGRIFHLEQKSERSFDLCIKDASCFQEILVSPNMLTDHLPNVVYDVLCAITGHFNEV